LVLYSTDIIKNPFNIYYAGTISPDNIDKLLNEKLNSIINLDKFDYSKLATR
jgi:hypothetical protein